MTTWQALEERLRRIERVLGGGSTSAVPQSQSQPLQPQPQPLTTRIQHMGKQLSAWSEDVPEIRACFNRRMLRVYTCARHML